MGKNILILILACCSIVMGCMLAKKTPIDDGKIIINTEFTGYTIQLSSESAPLSAYASLLEVQVDFPEAQIIHAFYDNRTWYRICVGNYSGEKEANDELGGVRKKYPQAFVILLGARSDGVLVASWYDHESTVIEGSFDRYDGLMANGHLFDENAMTCATNLFDLGVVLKVTNKRNGKTVFVRVTDRISDRFGKTRIDLTIAAFKKLDNPVLGLIPIDVEEVEVEESFSVSNPIK